ncbi:MAG: hypothetical protein CMH57_12920 [Myxococcales bacterium]|nr:hypothetical protein [Myxococcales bacterium]
MTELDSRTPDRPAWVCAAVTLLTFVVAASLLTRLTDSPMPPVPTAERSGRAAIALRDHVVPFQMWGSMIFTRPLLERSYESAYYLAQHSRGDRIEARLTQTLEVALREHEQVDLFIISHSNRFLYHVSRLDPELRQRLRLVYNTGCYDLDQARRWIALGADTYVGHPGLSASPVFYFFFLRRWVRAMGAQEAMVASNAEMKRILYMALPKTSGRLHPDVVWRDSEAKLSGDQEVSLVR